MTAVIDTPTVHPAWRGPGLYSADEISLDDYHRDIVPGGSLSSSGARKLLAPSCPALFKWERDNPPAPKPQFEYGTAAHKLILGEGPDLVLVDVDDWRTKDGRQQAADARAAGAIPLKRDDYEQIHAMADALRRHPVAGNVFDPAGGTPEQSLYWIDPITGVTCRARPDWLPNPGKGRLIIPDYKTTRDASPDAIAKAIHTYGYHCQAAWCIEAARALDLADRDAVFLLVFQAKTAPYLVTVVQIDALDLRIGHAKNAVARDIYRQCTDTGHWPGYSDAVEIIPQPEWAQKQEAEVYL
ncbi:PD-(D/E)XK nuclease-like domain-containing protein [Streptomyces sp. NPDC020983]|uniref:PD-(D/E)XK nuclease-like domain-containing protein n=1 Tax=Streptomyces sp. NPDC020983 TaxID=3365106 RepID=UPI0037B92E7E